jgi:HSP90 family molecular chaperone
MLQAFVKELQDKGQAGDAVKDIIGQFGVGFYSVSCALSACFVPRASTSYAD